MIWMSGCAWALGAGRKRLGALMQSGPLPNIKPGQELTGYS